MNASVMKVNAPESNHDTAILVHDRFLAAGTDPVLRQQGLRGALLGIRKVAVHEAGVGRLECRQHLTRDGEGDW